MKNQILALILVAFFFGSNRVLSQNIITSDVTNFWDAYDKITSTQDSILQFQYLDSLYFAKGTPGLEGIRQARNYSAKDYIDAINNYPKFWNSVRKNTLKATAYKQELQEGIEALEKLYPESKDRKIYFTIGAMRTGGTYLDSLVLIGSEMAFADENTIASELPEETRQGRQDYFNQNPIDDVVFLAIQEYVHTQQNPFVHNLLSYCIHEGIGDFVANVALGIEPKVPAILYGRKNEAVRKAFEKEMFYGNNVSQWLWSDAPNDFGVRDLGYYIGYQICENYYDQASDKKAAIKDMIELNYENESQIEDYVHKSAFFSTSLDKLYQDFEKRRPTVVSIKQFENNSQEVSPAINQITVNFSRRLNGHNTGVDYGNLGEEAFPKKHLHGRFWADDNSSWTIPVELEPNKRYQILISNNFRTESNVPLKPYLIDFKTGNL